MEKYIDYDMCKECGGQCCKENGCVYLPQDFDKLDFNSLRDQIEKGYISISGQPITGFLKDAWTFLLYLRARNRDADVVDLITYGGPCKLLTEVGCSLTEEERPSLGLLVKPTKIGGPCEKKFEPQIALDWIDHSEVLAELVTYYTDKDVIDVVVEQITAQMDTLAEKKQALEDFKAMEKINFSWYHNVMVNKPYYTPEEVKRMILAF